MRFGNNFHPKPINFKPMSKTFIGGATVVSNSFPRAKPPGRVVVPKVVEEPDIEDPFVDVSKMSEEAVVEVKPEKPEPVEYVEEEIEEPDIEEVVEEVPDAVEAPEEPCDQEEDVCVLDKPALEVLSVERSVENAFKSAGVVTVQDVVDYWDSNKNLTSMKGIGPKSENIIISQLSELGIQLV